MKKHLTIILPTYNRDSKLYRLLRYFDSVNFNPKIVILDSGSSQEKKAELRILLKSDNIHYYKFENIPPMDKLCQGINYITTPYATFCADDDFISPSALTKCIEFLETNTEYYSVQGKYMAFWVKNKHLARVHPTYYQGKDLDIDSFDLSNRLKKYFSLYTPIFYTLCRAELLKVFSEKIRAAELLSLPVINLSEIFLAFIALIWGKHKVLPNLYCAREGLMPYVPSKALSVAMLLQHSEYSDVASRFYSTLESVIVEKYSIPRSKARLQVLAGIDAYLNSYIPKVKSGIIKRDASREMVKGQLGYPYYNNTEEIREWERMKFFITNSLLSESEP